MTTRHSETVRRFYHGATLSRAGISSRSRQPRRIKLADGFDFPRGRRPAGQTGPCRQRLPRDRARAQPATAPRMKLTEPAPQVGQLKRRQLRRVVLDSDALSLEVGRVITQRRGPFPP